MYLKLKNKFTINFYYISLNLHKFDTLIKFYFKVKQF